MKLKFVNDRPGSQFVPLDSRINVPDTVVSQLLQKPFSTMYISFEYVLSAIDDYIYLFFS